jgi:hypothetical protein
MKLSVVVSYLGVLCIFTEGVWLGGLIFTGSFNEFVFGLAVGLVIWLFSIEFFVDDQQEIRAKIRELQAKLERLQKEEVPPPP